VKTVNAVYERKVGEAMKIGVLDYSSTYVEYLAPIHAFDAASCEAS
jgi:hypothetical protein